MYISAVAAGDGRGDTGDTTLAVQGPNRAHNRTQVRERQTDANTNTSS